MAMTAQLNHSRGPQFAEDPDPVSFPRVNAPRTGPAGCLPLSRRGLDGALWITGSAALNKVITAFGQIILAWLLVPEQMGLAAQALAIAGFIGMFTAGPLGDVLVQRQEHFDQEASQVFWMALTINFFAACLLIAIGVPATKAYGNPQVASMVVVVAISWLIASLGTVYGAQLRKNLRFKAVAMVYLMQGITFTGCAIALAAAGWGAFALIAPLIPQSVVTAVLVRLFSGPLRIEPPRLQSWSALLVPSLWLMVMPLATALQSYGPNFVVSIVLDPRETGLYAWGYALAAQGIFLLSGSLRNVFFPVLASINTETDRQFNIIVRSCRAMTAVVAPFCVLQALLAEPVMKQLFHDRWWPSAAVVSWLSLGLITQPFMVLVSASLPACGQFRLLALILIGQGLSVMTAAAVGTRYGGDAKSVAACVAVALLLAGVVGGIMLARSLRQSALSLLSAFGSHALLAGISLIFGVLIKGPALQHGIIMGGLIITGVTLTPQLAWFLTRRARGKSYL